MRKQEISEIKKLFTPGNCSITRICGCYVECGENKKTEWNQAFLALPEDELYKYFEILRKSLSGTLGKNLLNLEFSEKSRNEGGQQEFFLHLRDSKLRDDVLLEQFYDRIIKSYEYVGNYLILLIHDAYDIPVDHMEAQEYEELKTGCTRKRDRAMMELLRSTAIRVGEMERLNVNDIDWRAGSVSVYGQKTRTYRTVYLDDIALKYLGEYIQERGCSINSRDPLFVSERCANGKYSRLSDAGIRSALKSIASRAEVERRVYPHLFRKTTATNICKRGGTIWDAGHYLGHKDRSTAGQHYVAEDQECMRSIFRLRVATV